MVLAAGTLVTNNVRLVRLLGEGGMGSVWIADHLSLGTQVAVKFILETANRSPNRIARFKREASVAAQIKSPHVVQIFDHGVMTDGTPYIVMELLEGENLSARLNRGALTLGQAKLLVAQVAEVLNAAHELGIAHRDLKPDNLFLVKSGYELFVKVLDFGIAKQMEMNTGMTSPGAMMGTPMYMSPEQIESASDASHHCDLWALTVVTYEALIGKAPFQGETVGALCIAISKAKFAPATQQRPSLPVAVDDWFERALQREPASRYQTAHALRDGFRTITTGAVSRLEANAHARTWRPRIAAFMLVLAGGSAAMGAYASLNAGPRLQPNLPIPSVTATTASEVPALAAPMRSAATTATSNPTNAAAVPTAVATGGSVHSDVSARSRPKKPPRLGAPKPLAAEPGGVAAVAPPPVAQSAAQPAKAGACRYLVNGQVQWRPCKPRVCKYLDGEVVKERPCR